MNLEKELVNLGYKVTRKNNDVEMDFESDIVNGFKLSGKSYVFDDKYSGISVVLLIKNDKFNDFEEYGTLLSEWKVVDTKFMLMKLKSLIEGFYECYGKSEKQAIEYNYDELEAFDKKITELYLLNNKSL